jgi:hypothetical protein
MPTILILCKLWNPTTGSLSGVRLSLRAAPLEDARALRAYDRRRAPRRSASLSSSTWRTHRVRAWSPNERAMHSEMAAPAGSPRRGQKEGRARRGQGRKNKDEERRRADDEASLTSSEVPSYRGARDLDPRGNAKAEARFASLLPSRGMTEEHVVFDPIGTDAAVCRRIRKEHRGCSWLF